MYKRGKTCCASFIQPPKPISHEEVLAEFGFTMTDFERMGRTPLPPEPQTLKPLV
jgi:hypothetical protein